MRVDYEQYIYAILTKVNLILIKIICIDKLYFALSYCNKLYLSFSKIPNNITNLTSLKKNKYNTNSYIFE